jgi:hypothetical protein
MSWPREARAHKLVLKVQAELELSIKVMHLWSDETHRFRWFCQSWTFWTTMCTHAHAEIEDRRAPAVTCRSCTYSISHCWTRVTTEAAAVAILSFLYCAHEEKDRHGPPDLSLVNAKSMRWSWTPKKNNGQRRLVSPQGPCHSSRLL